MKFNVYLADGTPLEKNISDSQNFKKIWQEQEVNSLLCYYGADCKIIPCEKKTDTN